MLQEQNVKFCQRQTLLTWVMWVSGANNLTMPQN